MKTTKSVAVVLAAAILASGGGLAASAVTASPAQAATAVTTPAPISAAVTKILNNTNAERAKVGLAPLTLVPSMNTVAQNWTDKEAAGNFIKANPTLWKEIPSSLNTKGQGQLNISGANADNAVQYWMDGGYANEIRGDYTHVGIGYTVDENGNTYINQSFGKYTTTPNIPVINPNGASMTSTTASISWYGSFAPNRQSITDYKVELYSAEGVLLQTKTVPYDFYFLNQIFWADFTGLTPDTTYTAKITAHNAHVTGVDYYSPTKVLTVTTAPPKAAAPNAPTSLTAISTVYNQATLSWKPPTGVVGTITSYDITVKQAGQADRIFWTTGTAYTVTGLTGSTDYTVEVSARVAGADGQSTAVSPAVTTAFKTAIFYPVAVSEPTNYVLSNVASDAATISWKAPVNVTGKLVDYTVRVTGPTGEKAYQTTATSYRITGLSAKTDYGVTVEANAVSLDGLNHATGYGGGTTFVTSFPNVEVTAPLVSVGAIGADRFTVSWAKSFVTGTLTGYRVTVKSGTIVKQTYTLPATTTSKQILALAENTSYTVTVDAFATAPNGINKATATTTKTVKTGLTAASTVKVAAPAAFTTVVSRSAVTASWKMPVVTGRVLNYTVTLKEGTRLVKTGVTGAGKYSFTGLKANTAYTVTVTANAVSANGKYKASASVSKAVRTLR